MATYDQEPSASFHLDRTHVAGIVLVSAVYFADIFLRAREKCYWFDELFTEYLCRLRNFSDIWKAVLNGVDFNPPLFYLLTRASRSLFGNGLIATRLPSAVGVWLFGLCLFLFVSRRTGAICGAIAGVFPFFTQAQYYAYEARAHGVALGWCGLAIVCWQMIGVTRGKYLWLVAFLCSLLGALLTHVYAVYLLVPFALVELYNCFRKGGPDWRIVSAIAVAFSAVTLTVYLPLVRAYRGYVPPTFSPASHDLLQRFMSETLGPAVVVFLVLLLLFTLESMGPPREARPAIHIPARELVLALGFACLPVVGLAGSKISHGPFFGRYFLVSIAGYAMLLGFATSRWNLRLRSVRALAGFMCLLMVADLAATSYLTAHHRVLLKEPSSGLSLSTNPADPMRFYQSLATDERGLDVMVLGNLECLYFYRYAPQAVASHLYFVAPANDFFLAAYERIAKGAHIDLKSSSFGSFLDTHRRFLVYSTLVDSAEAQQAMVGRHYELKSVRRDIAGTMYEYAK